MIGYKTSLNKFKKIEIISYIFSDNNGLKLQPNLKEKIQTYSNSWRLNTMLLRNERLIMRSRKKSKSFWKQMKMNTPQSKTYGHSEGSPAREVHSDTGLPKKTQKHSK